MRRHRFDALFRLTRRDGRLVLALCALGVVLLGLPIVTSHMGPAARGPDPSPAPAPSTPRQDEGEVHGERDAIEAEERVRRADNWIWRPSEAEIAERRDGNAMLFIGPIVDKKTENRLEADVYVNGRPVARAERVALLMWQTRQDPVSLDVYKAGYERWGFRYRFDLDGLKTVEGPVELAPDASDDDGEGGMAWR